MQRYEDFVASELASILPRNVVPTHPMVDMDISAGSGKTTLIQALCLEYFVDGKLVLAAPTGKAARNLTERTGLPARTVHSALGKIPDEDFLDPVKWSTIRMVVVDEASMLSLELGCPVTRLEQQYRQSDKEAALFYNIANFPKLCDSEELKFDESFKLIPTNEGDIFKVIQEEAVKRHLAGENVQVIATTRDDVKRLNETLQQVVNPPAEGKPEVTHISAKIGSTLTLAYALTVHKSQGSQYDTVIMPASTDCQRMLRRNLFYTAISRAKKQVILVGCKEALHIAMVTPPEPRKSMLVIKTHQKMHFAA